MSSEPRHDQRRDIQVKPVPFPNDTWLKDVSPWDYADSFMAEWASDRSFSSEDMLIALFCRTPAWLKFLYRLRNLMVKLLRITAETNVSNDGGDQAKQVENLAEAIREGRSYGMFSVPFKSRDETVLSGADRHLDFYLSLQAQSGGDGQQRMTATTVVRYNNKTGRLYFFFVRPFHRVIVPIMMRGAIRMLEKGPSPTNPA